MFASLGRALRPHARRAAAGIGFAAANPALSGKRVDVTIRDLLPRAGVVCVYDIKLISAPACVPCGRRDVLGVRTWGVCLPLGSVGRRSTLVVPRWRRRTAGDR